MRRSLQCLTMAATGPSRCAHLVMGGHAACQRCDGLDGCDGCDGLWISRIFRYESGRCCGCDGLSCGRAHPRRRACVGGRAGTQPRARARMCEVFTLLPQITLNSGLIVTGKNCDGVRDGRDGSTKREAG